MWWLVLTCAITCAEHHASASPSARPLSFSLPHTRTHSFVLLRWPVPPATPQPKHPHTPTITQNARNVLLSSSGVTNLGVVAKLADLGLSRIVRSHRSHHSTNTVGTMSHVAPGNSRGVE